MANRRSQNWLNQQRVDVPHLRSIESAVRNDFDELISSFAIGESASYILRGFEINMVGAIGSSASSLQLIVEESSIFHGKSNTSGTFFQVPVATPNETLNSTTNTKVNGAFTPSSLNYVGLELKREVDNSTVSQLFFWNPTNNTEFNKSTPLAQLLDYEIVITSTVWGSNVLPLAIVQTDSSNSTLNVEDRRPMFFRLGTAGETSPDPFYEYPWTNHAEGRTENPFVSSSSTSPFRGGDKQIKHLKEWADAVMSQIKELKGTTYWYSFNSGGSIIKLRNDVVNTQITGAGKISHSDATAGLLNWDEDFYITYVTSRLQFKIAANDEPGTDLQLNDNEVAYIRTVRDQSITPRLIFTNGSAIVGSVGAVAWTADVLAGDYVKIAAEDSTRYFQIDTVDSLSQVTLTEIYDGTSTGSLGDLAEYAWGTYEVNATPSTDRHIQITSRELVPFDEDVYWLFLRADNGGSVAKVYLHGVTGGELEQGEERQISDNTTLEVLAYIGAPGEADPTPDYTNAITTGVAEVATHTFPAASALTGGQSFQQNAAGDFSKYTFYVIKDGIGAPPAAPGRITVGVNIVAADTATQVATKYQAVIDAITHFDAVDNLDGTVTITNSAVGVTTDAANNDMGAGYSVAVDIQGAGAANFALIDDENLTQGIKRVDQAVAQNAAAIASDTWKPPVANYAALPASGNTDGDVRLVLETRIAYHWDNTQALWLPLTGTSSLKLIGGGTIAWVLGPGPGSPTVVASHTGSTVALDSITNNLTSYAQSFTASDSGNILTSSMWLSTVGSPIGDLVMKLYSDNGAGVADTLLATSDVIDISTIGAAAVKTTFNYSSPFALVSGTRYHVAIDPAGLTTVDGPNNFRVHKLNTYAGEDASLSFNNGASWIANAGTDYLIEVTASVAATVEQITFTDDMYLEKAGLDYTDNTIPTSESPISLPNDLDVAYVQPNLIAGGSDLTVTVDTLVNVPLTALIIARREGNDVIVGSSSTRLALGESMQLYGSKTDQDKDKMRGADYGYFRSDQQVTWTGSELQFLDDIIFETVNRAGTVQLYTVDVADSPLTLADGEYLYLLIDRTLNSQTLSFVQSSTIPAIPAAGTDLVIFAKRVDALGAGYLHLPLNKQVLEPGQTVRIGASGSGGGAGDSMISRFDDRLALTDWNFYTPNVFELDKDTKLDPSSTGEYSLIDKNFKFSNPGETMVSAELADPDFLDDESTDIDKVEVVVEWDLDNIDTNALYEVTRDDNSYETISMERVGQTDTYQGVLNFANETNPNGFENGVADGTLTLDDTNDAQVPFSISRKIKLNTINLTVEKNNSPEGSFYLQFIKDDGGSPSTDPNDVVYTTPAQPISALSAGANILDIDLGGVFIVGDYHIVFQTDQAYKDAYALNAANNIEVETVGGDLRHNVMGREFYLKLRITSSVGDVNITGYALFYDNDLSPSNPDIEKHVEEFTFSGNENRTVVPINFVANERILKVYDKSRGQVYVAGESTFRVQGNELVFQTNFFDFPGETIELRIEQIEGNGFDNSDQNAQEISEILNQLIDIGDQLESVSDSMVVPKIAAPFATVVNRALIPDFSMDMKPRMGIERIITQDINILQEEVGPNNQAVYGVVNDQFNRIRLVGSWSQFTLISGTGFTTTTVGDYIEVTFYGTGLNILTNIDVPSRDLRVSVDGGAEGSNILYNGSSIIAGRNCAANVPIPVVNNLTAGIHTVKIRSNNVAGVGVFGFEVLNESAQIQVNPGAQLFKGKRLINSTIKSLDYNSDFASGTLGSRGGNVIIYQNEDGTIEKAVNPTNPASAFTTSANHNNEKILRTYDFRDFGFGRADDFSILLGSTVNAAWTMEDGTTSLVGSQVRGDSGLYPVTTAGYIMFTFIGTGLDIIEGLNSSVTTNYTVEVDGVNVATGVTLFSGVINNKVRICSGLPYGTHTVRITRNAALLTGTISKFVVYGPKDPTIPVNAKALSQYFVMADYTQGSSISDVINSVGVLKKVNTREYAYVGASWSITSLNPGIAPGGYDIRPVSNGNYYEYTFFGTGFSLPIRANAGSADITLTLDGSTNFTGLTVNQTASGTFTTATGTYTGTINDGHVGVSGLDNKKHTVRVTFNNAGSVIYFSSGLDIITPIHAPVTNGPVVLQDVIDIGSCGIKDLRKFSRKDIVQDEKSFSSTNLAGILTATLNVIFPSQLKTTIYLEEDCEVEYSIEARATVPAGLGPIGLMYIYINGIGQLNILQTRQLSGTATWISTLSSSNRRKKLSKGFHTFQLHVQNTDTLGTYTFDNAILNVKKVSK